MTVMVIFRSPQLDRAKYDGIIEALDLEHDPPAGAVLHMSGFTGQGICVVDAWESREAFEDFLQNRLQPAFRKVGVDPQPPEIIELYAMTGPAAAAYQHTPAGLSGPGVAGTAGH